MISFLLSIVFVTTAQSSSANDTSTTNSDQMALHNLYRKKYILNATKDVLIRSPYKNYNDYDYIALGRNAEFSKSRSLIQFEEIPEDCIGVISAKMYLWYWKSYKPYWQSDQEAPYLSHTFKVFQIKKYWNESQATSRNRKSGISSTSRWRYPYLGLDGTDAYAKSLDSVFFPNPPPNETWIEFDITQAAQNWKSGKPNYGVVISSSREHQFGREIRFYSREHNNSRPYLELQCTAALQPSSVIISSTNSLYTSPPTSSPTTPTTVSLQATKDVLLESGYSNFNYLNFLILAKHPGYPRKRSLIQFQDIPSHCINIISAKMYIWHWYSHKASGLTNEQAPYLSHTFNVHQIKKE